MTRSAQTLGSLLVAASLIASCSTEKEPMPPKTHAEATQQVREYAQTVAAAIGLGGVAEYETGVSASPCRGPNDETAGDGRFYVQGNYQLPLTVDHERVLASLHDSWRAQGWAIKAFRMFTEDEGTVSAENPSDNIQISVESTRPPTALALLILTPCYALAG